MSYESDELINIRQETETVIHSASDFAPVAYMRVKRARLVDKEPVFFEPILPPSLLAEEFENLHLRLSDVTKDVTGHNQVLETSQKGDLAQYDSIKPSSTRTGSWVSVSNVQVDPNLSEEKSIEKETVDCFQILHCECYLFSGL